MRIWTADMGFQCYIPCHAHAPRSVTILAVQFRQMHGAGEEHEERKPVTAQLSSLCVSFKCRGRAVVVLKKFGTRPAQLHKWCRASASHALLLFCRHARLSKHGMEKGGGRRKGRVVSPFAFAFKLLAFRLLALARGVRANRARPSWPTTRPRSVCGSVGASSLPPFTPLASRLVV